jgi:hypothetical protein
MDELPPALPLGTSGRLEAQPLVNVAGNHALLVREGEASRALITGEAAKGRDRVVVVPLDDDVELRVDGDALAVWLAQGSVTSGPAQAPAWASLIGFVLVLLVIAFAVIGSMVTFSWLVDLIS